MALARPANDAGFLAMTTSERLKELPMQHDTATTSFLDRPHGRLAYDVTGQGPLVIASPGLGDGRQSFRFLVAELAGAGYRIATMDLRGHGQSSTGWPCAVPKLAVQALSWHFSTKDMVGLRGGAVQIERQGR
jgi:pimeloyl-ACP methyl ester carboxylesterase